MKYSFSFLLVGVFTLVIFISCKTEKIPDYELSAKELDHSALIPKPVSVKNNQQAFALDKTTQIFTEGEGYNTAGTFLKEQLNIDISLDLELNQAASPSSRGIYIQNANLESTNPEAYILRITKDSIQIQANKPEGAFRGVQTFLQLVPQDGIDSLASWKVFPIPGGLITDEPNFAYRGTMLDVSRHFFSIEEVKKHIDILARFKINKLHLHLSDDQGWRIEIKSWPKLTEVGSLTEVGGGDGGFYTQEEYKDLISYAAERFITIIPEIDMPGHTNAALVAYPQFNGNGKDIEVYTGKNVGFSTVDTRNDSTYIFLEEIIREIAEITPGEYFHIGGDESHVTKEEDYLYFINKIEKIVRKHGKTMIGWDEVSHADITPPSTVQFWRPKADMTLAVKKGLPIIVSPAHKAYLDMKYDDNSEFGLTWAAKITTKDAYKWNPETIANAPKEQILGIEAPLWSETISNSAELEYLAYPRLLGYAELGWSKTDDLSWDNYKVRLAQQSSFFEKKNINFYRDPQVDWVE